MFRSKLEEIGDGQRIRIIAQHQHYAYIRMLLLLRVSLLEKYMENGKDVSDINTDGIGFIGHNSVEYLTDHVHLNYKGVDDNRLMKYIECGDILICNCEVYKYPYQIGSYENQRSGNTENYAVRNPADIVVLRPLKYGDELVFLPISPDKETDYCYYVGAGTRKGAISDWWNFNAVKELPKRQENGKVFNGDIMHWKGYEVVDESENRLSLSYKDIKNDLVVYKSIKGYLQEVS